MAIPPAQLMQLKAFVSVLKAKPDVLHTPELSFFKEWVLLLLLHFCSFSAVTQFNLDFLSDLTQLFLSWLLTLSYILSSLCVGFILALTQLLLSLVSAIGQPGLSYCSALSQLLHSLVLASVPILSHFCLKFASALSLLFAIFTNISVFSQFVLGL